jgi:hypothetical protein
MFRSISIAMTDPPLPAAQEFSIFVNRFYYFARFLLFAARLINIANKRYL